MATPPPQPTPSVSALNKAQKQTLADFNTPWKLSFWLLYKLPAAWFMGVRVKHIDARKSEVRLPYGWRSQNPFKSIYFAAQMAAAEFATGALAVVALAGRGRIAMLVTHIESEFMKKAQSTTVFTCEEGAAVFEAVEKAIETGLPQTLVMTAIGRQASGEVVSVTRITWSFKAKN